VGGVARGLRLLVALLAGAGCAGKGDAGPRDAALTDASPAPDAAVPASRLFVIPHFLETEGRVLGNTFVHDTLVQAVYTPGLAGSPAGPGATIELYLYGDGAGAPLLNHGLEVCNPCRVELDGATRYHQFELDTLISVRGGSFDTPVKVGFALLRVSGDLGGVTLAGQLVNARTGPLDTSMTALAIRPVVGGVHDWVVPRILDSSGRITSAQYAIDTSLQVVYVPGLAGSAAGAGATVDLYLYAAGAGAPLSNNGQPVCNPCSANLGGASGVRKHSFDVDALIRARGDFDSPLMLGFAVVRIGGADPGGVALGGFAVNARTSPQDLGIKPLTLRPQGAGAGDWLLPRVLEREGEITGAQFTFDSAVHAVYSAGLGAAPPGAGASVELYLYDTGFGAPLMNHGQEVCNPCVRALGGASGLRQTTFRIDDLISTRGGSFDTPVKLAGALVRVTGADAGNVTLSAELFNARTGVLDLEMAELPLAPRGRWRARWVIPHVIESAGRVSSTQYAFDTIIQSVFADGLPGGPGSGSADADLFLYTQTGAPLQNLGTDVCSPCSAHLAAGAGPRTQAWTVDNLIEARGGMFDAPVKVGFAIVRTSGAQPLDLALGGFVVNAATGPFDLATMPLLVDGDDEPPPKPAPDGGVPDAGLDAALADAALPDAAVADAAPAEWTSRSSGVTTTLNAVAYGDGRYLVGGQNATLRESADGISWSASVSGGLDAFLFPRGLAYSPGAALWVLSGDVSGSTQLYRRAAGTTTWTAGSSDTAIYRRIVWLDAPLSMFVAATSRGIRTSPDGITWTTPASASTGSLVALAWGGAGKFIVVVGGAGRVLQSLDGLTWTDRSLSTATPAFLHVAGHDDVFVAVADSEAPYYSTDGGTSWTSASTLSTPRTVAWTGTTFVGLGAPGGIPNSSPNGITWSRGALFEANDFNTITPAGPRLVAVGTSGVIATRER